MTVPPIETAEYLGGHKIRIVFSDGTIRFVYFLPVLHRFSHPDYDCYLDETEFKEFKIVDGNLDWNDFHMSFTPESLYQGEV